MKRCAVLLVVIGVLVSTTGCAARINKIMASWEGQHVSNLIASWGLPQQVLDDGAGGQILVYTAVRSYTTPGQATTYTTGSATAYGNWATGSATSTTTYTPGQTTQPGFLVSARPLAAQPSTITTEGYGTVLGGDMAQARDEAIIDARIRALKQVAGVFVDAKTLVENEMLLDAMVRDPTQGLVTSYKVLKEGPTGDGRYRVLIEVRVVPDEVKQKLLGLTSDFAMVVMIEETNLGQIQSPPIVENAVVTKLVEAGYSVADPNQVLKVRERDRMKALLDNDLDAIKAIAGRFLANLLVMGRALSEPSQVTQGILSARARVSLRVVEAETGRILVNREVGDIRGFDLAQDRAGQKALRAAGEAITEYLQEQLDQLFMRKERSIEVRVRGLASLEDLQRLKKLLQSLRWVSGVQEKAYDPGESIITLRYPEKTLYLVGRIGRESDYRVVQFDRSRILVEAKKPERPPKEE